LHASRPVTLPEQALKAWIRLNYRVKKWKKYSSEMLQGRLQVQSFLSLKERDGQVQLLLQAIGKETEDAELGA